MRQDGRSVVLLWRGLKRDPLQNFSLLISSLQRLRNLCSTLLCWVAPPCRHVLSRDEGRRAALKPLGLCVKGFSWKCLSLLWVSAARSITILQGTSSVICIHFNFFEISFNWARHTIKECGASPWRGEEGGVITPLTHTFGKWWWFFWGAELTVWL